MNERIKELADKVAEIMPAGVYNLRYESGKRGVEFTEDALEKFAELIVKECIDIAQDRANFPGYPPNDVNDIIDEIKEHFGVGE